MGTPREKAAALARGDEKYFTGRPCKVGHIGDRYTSTGNCVECAIAYRKERDQYYAVHSPRRKQKWILWQKYRLTLDDFDTMISDQRGRCAVCVRPFIETPFVDHCHRSGENRALLCRGCNTALGHARDEPYVLRALADYLEAHQS